jgi:hypothetical protein
MLLKLKAVETLLSFHKGKGYFVKALRRKGDGLFLKKSKNP